MASSNDTISRIFDTFALTSKSRYVFIYDIARDYARWSINAVNYFGLSGEYIDGALEDWMNFIHPGDREGYREYFRDAVTGKKVDVTFAYRAKNKNGEFVDCSCKGVVIKDYANQPAYFACFVTNRGVVGISDPVTHLPNQFELLNMLHSYREKKHQYVLLLLGVIDFPALNHRFGYSYGNAVLQAMTDQLREKVGNRGIVYRCEGTTMAVCSDVMSSDELRRVYGQFQIYARAQMQVQSRIVGVELCAGMIVADDPTIDEHSIYTSAKFAMEASRTKLHGALSIFHNDENERQKSSIGLVDAVRDSVLNNFDGFFLTYQPIFRRDDRELAGMEVFVRWKKEPYGEVSAGRFVPWLEKDPVFYQLGNWVLQHALEDAAMIRSKRKNFFLNVNLAYMQLERSGFRKTLMEYLKRSGYPGTGLCLELDATGNQMGVEHLRSELDFLKSLGIHIGLDVVNFAALDLVTVFPIDIIKLGPKFATDIEKNPTNVHMMTTISEFAARMHLATCVSGIEDEKSDRVVKQFPVSYLQGYYFGRPAPLDQFRKQYLQ